MEYAQESTASKNRNLLQRIWRFYYEGFRQMTIGKTLWAIILLKLFIFFVVIKLLFFPDLLKKNYDTDEERADHVRRELLDEGKRGPKRLSPGISRHG